MILRLADFIRPTKSAASFILLMLCMDFAGAHFVATQFTVQVQNLNNLLSFAGASIAWFVLRLLCLSFVLIVVLSIFEKMVRVKRKVLFYIVLFGYVFLLLSVRTPQVFDDWLLNSILPINRENWSSKLILFISVVLMLLLNIKFLIIYRFSFFRKIQFYGANAIAMIFLVVNYSTLLSDQNVQLEIAKLKKLTLEQKNENIIAVLIDSFPHNKEHLIRQHANTNLLNFLDSSHSFKAVFSEFPQTHGALYALFSGQTPYQSGVRYAYHSSSRFLDSIELGSLSELKKKGYEVHIIADVMETSPLTAGKSIDSVYGPQFGFETSIISKIFYSKLFHGFFDNVIGEFFFPNLFYNNSFSFSYDSRKATMKNIEQMNKVLASSDKPKFILFHVCTLHIPGIWKYPYYPKVGNPAMKGRQFSYLYGFNAVADANRINNRGEFNAEVFSAGVKMLTAEVLNPLFDYLTTNDLVAKSNILLFSDHGENLWEENIDFPKVRIPFHGDTLLYSSNAERAYLKASLVNGKQANPQESISISNLIERLFLNKTFDAKLFYVETGFNPFKDFNGILKTATSSLQSTFMKMDDKTGMIYVDPYVDKVIIMEKQRAIMNNDYRYTVFPTLYGRKKFLCHQSQDPNCLIDVEDTSLNNKYFFEMKNIYLQDQAKDQDFAPSDAFDPDRSIDQLRVGLNSGNEWLRVYANIILFFKFQDFDFAIKNIYSIYTKTEDQNLLKFIKQNLVRFCTDEKSVNLLAGEMVFGRNEQNFIAWDVHREFLLCVDMFSRARTAEGNFENAFKTIRGLNPQYFKGTSLKVSIAELEKDFSIKLNYRLENELDGYYFIKFYLLKNQSNELAFKTILKDLSSKTASKNFELLFFNYLEEHFKIPIIRNADSTEVPTDRRKIRLDKINRILRKME